MLPRGKKGKGSFSSPPRPADKPPASSFLPVGHSADRAAPKARGDWRTACEMDRSFLGSSLSGPAVEPDWAQTRLWPVGTYLKLRDWVPDCRVAPSNRVLLCIDC